jgi:hypothetical protein
VQVASCGCVDERGEFPIRGKHGCMEAMQSRERKLGHRDVNQLFRFLLERTPTLVHFLPSMTTDGFAAFPSPLCLRAAAERQHNRPCLSR